MNETPRAPGFLRKVANYFCTPQLAENATPDPTERIDWFRTIPYLSLHVGCLAVLWVGWSWLAVSIAVFLYALRVFTLTGFYHRYFSHRSFKTWRIVQFVFGWIGCMSIQRGPLWWAAHHRYHHIHSDDPLDLHSPRQKGLFWSHMGWFLTPRAMPTNLRIVPDFAKYPELRWLDRWDIVPALVMGALLFGFGELVKFGLDDPESTISGLQLFVWGFLISTIAVYHVTYLVNSATHIIGSRRYETKDDSKNSLIVALLTFGEGWHNNHHYYPNSTRQGFFWWEIDITYYVLCFMRSLNLVWDLKAVPERILHPKPKALAIPADAKPVTITVS